MSKGAKGALAFVTAVKVAAISRYLSFQDDNYDTDWLPSARTVMQMILRPASRNDLPAIRKILTPWTDEEPSLIDLIGGLFDPEYRPKLVCTVLEADKSILCCSIWSRDQSDEVRLHALGFGPAAVQMGIDIRFLREEISEWAEARVSRVLVRVPQSLATPVVQCLRACGFIFEGMSSSFVPDRRPRVRLCKYFRYGSLPYSRVMDLLHEFLVSLGCEVRSEGEGFGYRIRGEYRLPFVFSAWHRITRSGNDIIVHPPARVLEMHELETLFFPLRVDGRNEKPLFLPLEKKRAKSLIDMPREDAEQDSLFGNEILRPYRRIFANNITYCYPTALKRLRRGLPLLFYVSSIGIVGSGRVEDWYLDEPRNLYNNIDEMGYFDPEDVKEHAARTGPLAGKVLLIRFQWYRPFKRKVALEQIRKLDAGFNPQRTRALSLGLFQSILAQGNP